MLAAISRRSRRKRVIERQPLTYDTIGNARASLVMLGYKGKDVARYPGEYSEETIGNDVYFQVYLPTGDKVTWIYCRLSQRFKKLE